MNGNEIRAKFIKYFQEKGHTVAESSSLVPHNDPTLLFVNAGMVQFKKLFTGEEKRDYVRAVTSQRCVRAGGKHNDLENVGYTARHHTFFEMLGNFSFGDYFKEEAIIYAWDFLTKVLGLPTENLWVTIFDDDDEAEVLWKKVEGLKEGRIVRMGEAENFWAMGDTGPCGPCSEIHFDQGPEAGCGMPDCQLGCDCDRFLELWNLVFMQFERDEAGNLEPLPKPSIDTGMGLERITAVMQGKTTNYDSDIFTTVMARIAKVSCITYGEAPQSDTAFKVIVDHCRATVFLIADGVMPSNEGRGYVLRRIMRRAIRYGRTLGLQKPFLAEIADEVISLMHKAYPHILDAKDLIAKVVTNEEERFLETIDHGMILLEEEMQRMKDAGLAVIGGDFIFKLYDTYGFPKDIVRDVALEQGFSLDVVGFDKAMAEQRAQSKKSWHGAVSRTTKGFQELFEKAGVTDFVGYTENSDVKAMIKAMLDEEGEAITTAEVGQDVMFATDTTPFYGQSGGQVGDRGEVVGPNGRAAVNDTIKTEAGVFLHKAKIQEGQLSEGDQVRLGIGCGRRREIEANHTATHLLQAALRKVLGEHVKQAGSLVEEKKLRFDFTNFSPLSPEELIHVEDLVNADIRANISGNVELMDKEQAQKSGATALFGEKYGQVVRVVEFGGQSKEFCGGTHVGATGEIGMFKILTETGIAAGVRRITAVTGQEAFSRCRESERLVSELAAMLKAKPEEAGAKLEELMRRQKELEKELRALTSQLSVNDLDAILNNTKSIDGVKICCGTVTLDSPQTLRELGDKLRDKMASGVAVLGGDLEGKAAILVVVSKDLISKCHAGKIIKEVAAFVGGGGGGRPDMAQAGGPMVDKLPEALEAAYGIVGNQLK